jgi:hypothetical protein
MNNILVSEISCSHGSKYEYKTPGLIALMMEAVSTSLKSVNFNKTTRNNITKDCKRTAIFRCLGGVVVSVLVIETKGNGFKPGRSDGFLRAIKIRSTPSFRWEVKPEVPCRKLLRHVKDPMTYQRY